MPGMTGIQLAAEVRVRHPGLPVILASGYAELPSAEPATQLLRLTKPFTQQQLENALAKSLPSLAVVA